MRQPQHFPLWCDANRLLLAIEQALRDFPRYHKYTLGTDMRRQAMTISRLVRRAAPRGDDQLQRVVRLVEKELQAFQSFKHFQSLTELVVAVGKQSGGWRKRLLLL